MENIDASTLLDMLREAITQPELPGSDSDIIRVMSLHKSKGLTAAVVVVAGCMAGALPKVDRDAPQAEQDTQLEEQRRLFYVAITRATQSLVISSSLSMAWRDALAAGIDASRGFENGSPWHEPPRAVSFRNSVRARHGRNHRPMAGSGPFETVDSRRLSSLVLRQTSRSAQSRRRRHAEPRSAERHRVPLFLRAPPCGAQEVFLRFVQRRRNVGRAGGERLAAVARRRRSRRRRSSGRGSSRRGAAAGA